jgi:hypothetical protein
MQKKKGKIGNLPMELLEEKNLIIFEANGGGL